MSETPDNAALLAAARRGEPVAQYNLGVSYLRGDGVAADPALAREWIGRASAAGLAAAQSALALLYLRAIGGPYDPAGAVALFRRASAQDFGEAIYRHAEALATGLGGSRDPAAARAELQRAADAGHALAQCQLAYSLDAGIGGAADPVAATEWLFRAAGAGAPRAAAALAERYRRGHTLERDPVRALAWFLRAEAGGYPGASEAAVGLRNTLEPDDVAAAQAAANRPPVSEPASDEHAAPPPPVVARQICASPRIVALADLLTPTECWHLIDIARPRLRPSQVLSSQSGRVARAPGRRSGGMSILAPLRDMVVAHIEQRLADLAQLPPEHGEPLAILRYAPGDEYRPHNDFFDPAIPNQATELRRGGQRVITVLMYLSDVAAGGATEFPNAGVSVAARRGHGVLFHNCDSAGNPDRASRHAGAPVRSGHKWLATKWIREREYPGAGNDR